MTEFAPSYENANNANYHLGADALRSLSRKVIAERELPVGERYVVVRVGGDDESSDLGRHIECQVFNEKFGNGENEMQGEYGPYEDASLFFIAMDVDRETPAGVLRVIRNGESGLKTIVDLADESKVSAPMSGDYIKQSHGMDGFDDCWDIGTVAVPREYRHGESGADIAVQLYRGMYVTAMENNVEHLVSVIDEKAHQILTKYLGIPFVPLGGSDPIEYLGSSKSQAVYGHVPEFYPKMNRQRKMTIRGLLARKALSKLVAGSNDQTLLFEKDDY